jgi:formyl-CoA transferase/succinyl-CoA--D-citramalate CoA-transferase
MLQQVGVVGIGRPSLEGLRVLEVGQMISGPFCGHLFADHGAEVIKVEPEDGDVMRTWGRRYHGLGLYWPIISRGKKSVTIDLRTAAGQETLRRLAVTADVLIENFRPGTLEAWGLGPDELHRANEALTVVRISGYGQDGPYRDRAGFGSVAEAMSGFRHLVAEPGRPPVRVGISLGDALAGTQGFIGALLALLASSRLGAAAGQVVDVSLVESMWMYMEGVLPEYDKLGCVRQPTGATLPRIAPSNVYPTRSSELIVMGANNDAVFARLAELMGRHDWVGPEGPFRTGSARGDAQEELDGRIAAWTATIETDELLELLHGAAIPASRVYTVADIARDPHYAAREMIVSVPEPNLQGEPVRGPGVVPRLSGTPGRVHRGGPLLGEHNDEVLGPLRAVDDVASRSC